MNSEGETHMMTVSPADAGERIDRFVTGKIPDSSRAQIQRAAKVGALTVDGVSVKVSHKVKEGETIAVQLLRPEDPDTAPLPESIDLDIVHEDDDIIIINKPAGMVVHPAAGHRTGTIVNALLGRNSFTGNAESVQRPGIVHRLDKGTSGLMVCARNESAHRHLAIQLRDRTMSRIYMAVAWGHFKTETTEFEGAIGRSVRDRKRMAVTESGRSAKTTAIVRERFELADLLELSLETGRTHQIRVHLTNAGHPIVSDVDYGGGAARLRGVDPARRLFGRAMLKAIDRPALHARKIRLVHPVSGEKLTFAVEPPADFNLLLDICRQAPER
jgi:23S rRNA pseudouridine1911/1915/1917 synthase